MSVIISDGSSSSFPQQGTVDWTTLASTSVQATVSILSRLSAAGIEPFTLTVAQAVAGQFKLSDQGKIRLRECLQSLKSFPSLDNVLWFGFGIKHAVRILSATTQGLSMLALCGGLSEVMSTDMVATILDKMPAIYGAPSELRPSLVQWEALVSTCAGVVSNTNFGNVAEHFMTLSGDGTIYWDKSAIGVRGRNCGYPEDIAAALCAIARVSQGSLIAVKLRGGAACGFLGALGLWFLGLEVEIRRGSSVVYRSVSDEIPVQIMITFGTDSSPADSQEVQVSSGSYYIRDFQARFVRRVVDLGDYNPVLSGRVYWETALQSTFGDVSEELFKAGYHFGRVLGNAARLFTALVNAEFFDIGDQYLGNLDDPVTIHNDNSHGKGMLHFMVARFPELEVLDWRSMADCTEYSPDQARQEFRDAFCHLALVCGCSRCAEHTNYGASWGDKPFCVPMLAWTILLLVRNLAFVHLDADLQPYRVGLEGLYHDHERRLDFRKFRFPDLVPRLSMLNVLRTAQFVFGGNQESGGFSQALEGTGSELFSPAFTSKGCTFYLDILRELSDQPETAGLLHVIPGNIVLDSGRMPALVQDSVPRVLVDIDATNYKRLSALPPPADTSHENLSMSLAVEESVRDVWVDFKFFRAGGVLCALGPARVLCSLARASYSVRCPRRMCPDLERPLHEVFSVDGEGMVHPVQDHDAGRLVVIRCLQGNAIARCLVLHHYLMETLKFEERNEYLEPKKVILKGSQCLSCCVKAALERETRPVYIL